MAGAGIVKAEYNDSEFQEIIDALSKASMPDLLKLGEFAGAELDYISKKKAFEKEKDPVSEKNWEKLKRPRHEGKKMLDLGGHLYRSLTWEAFPDAVIYGSNVEYARIHQEGGQTGRGKKSNIPARPYMGVTKDFDRRLLSDPEVLKLLGLEA